MDHSESLLCVYKNIILLIDFSVCKEPDEFIDLLCEESMSKDTCLKW